MATLTHDGVYRWRGNFEERLLPKAAGFRWDPALKIWWTDDSRKAAALAQYADESAKAALAVREETLAASKATDSAIEIPAPAGCEYLPYQRAGIAYAANRPDTLLADEQGLGKTIQAIGLINMDPTIKTVLVVAPKSLLINWQREAAKWLTRKVELVTINYDMIWKRADLHNPKTHWDLLILDESQNIKNPKAKRTKVCTNIPARRRILLTGTPILNRPVELWPTLQMLDPDDLGRNFFGFANRYCGAKQIRAGRKMVWDFTGASNLEELQEKMRTKFMVRRLKADVLTELPAKRRQIIPLDTQGVIGLLNKERQLLADLSFEEAAKRLEDGGGVAFTEMAKLRHELGVAKAPRAVEHITGMLDSVDKVIVFAHHHAVIETLARDLDQFGCVTITGQTSGADRQAAVDRFQTDPSCRVFVGNIRAAGVGITLTAASTVVAVEQDWTPGWMAQAEDRAHRIGQMNSVLIQYLVFDESMDANLAQTLVTKAAVANKALDADTVQDLSHVEVRVTEATAARQAKEVATETITQDQICQVHDALRRLASVCDGAKEQDGMGFNGLDSNFGKSLAAQSSLSPRQAIAARKMLIKYRRQLGLTF
jgi:SWI/SNF-related matrix-associated actin-dependent regulator 1 of chromatin subfamily A